MRASRIKHKKSSFKFFKKKEASYLKNIDEVNKLIQKIIFAMVLLPAVLMILTKIGFYNINEIFLNKLFFLAFIESVISVILIGVDRENCRRFVVYYQICACAVYISFLGSVGEVRVYITYSLVPFLSCMYYSTKTTIITSIFGYVTMIVSILARSKYEFWISPYSEDPMSQSQWLLMALISFSVEYLISFFAAFKISHKLKNDYDNLLKEQDVTDVLMQELKQKSEKVFEANDELVQDSYRLFDIQDKIIMFIGEVLGSHDEVTRNHIQKTKIYVGMIANDLREHGFYRDELTDEEIRYIEMGALLHDIGKLHVPEGILKSTTIYNEQEYNLMKTHAEEGKKLLEFLPKVENGRFNEIAIDMAYCHHEWWDGSGYPRGISGKQIPLAARIMGAADVLDATISKRVYKYPMSVEEAMNVFRQLSGKRFEPCISESVVRCRNQILEINRPKI